MLRPHRGTASAVVTVREDRLLRPDGVAITGVACHPVDVTSLDPARRIALTAAVGRLCRTLEAPVQLLLRIRRWEPVGDAAPARSAEGLATRLARAERRAEMESLTAVPAYRRSVVMLAAEPETEGPPRGQEAISSALAAAGVSVSRLDGRELADLLAESWSGPAPARGVVAPPAWSAQPTSLRSGNVLLRGMVLTRLPGVSVEAGWLAPLLRVRAESDIALHLEPVTLADAVSRLGRRLRVLHADQLADLDREGFGNAGVEAGVDGALELRERLARNEGRPLLLTVVATARGHDRAGLDVAATAVMEGFAASLAGAVPLHLEHDAAARSTRPLVDRATRGAKLVDSRAAASCVPFVEAVCDDPGGVYLGRAPGAGPPVRLDVFDRSRHVNANVAILAASGRGKSYAIATLLLGAAARGVGGIVVDPEGEYERVIGALGGTYLHLRPGSGAAVNVFDVVHDAEESGDAAVGAVVALVDTLAGSSLDDVERAHVDAAAGGALARARAEGRAAILGDCLTELAATTPRLLPVLRRFSTGQLGELFNRPTTLRMDADLVGVCLRDLRDELVPAATLVVAEWLWGVVRRDPRDRHIVFDEVGLLCAHPPLRALVTQLARRCRKYGASLVVATQNAGDLLSGEEGRVIATNPATVLLGGHHGAEAALMAAAYALTPDQQAWLEGAGRGEFLLLSGARRLPVHVSSSPLHHALITGAPLPTP